MNNKKKKTTEKSNIYIVIQNINPLKLTPLAINKICKIYCMAGESRLFSMIPGIWLRIMKGRLLAEVTSRLK